MKIFVNKKTNPRPFKANPIKDFKLSDLNIPSGYYQRIQAKWNVDRIAANFDPRAYTRPLIAIRDDGSQMVVNGGHTLMAMGLLGYQTASCEYFYSGSGKAAVRLEAAVYMNKNNMKTTSACEKFKAAVCMGHAESVRIWRILNSCGLHVYGMKGKGQAIRAVDACRLVYRNGGGGVAGAKHLEKVLSILANFSSWSGEKETLSAEVIGGLGIFLKVYGDAVEMRRLLSSMRGYAPGRLFEHQSATVTRTSNGPATRKKLAYLNFRKFYNQVSAVGRLPEVSVNFKKKTKTKKKAKV